MSEDSEQFLKDAGKDPGTYMPSDDDGFAANILKTLDDKKNAQGPTVKKAYDISTLSPRTKAILSKMEPNERAKYTGAFGGKLVEPIPEFIKTESELVYMNENNAYVVLGRDRPGNRETGYGGKGYTQCGSIDLVVGRDCPVPQAFDSVAGDKLFVDPNFSTDAARIYISQKADVDEYFDLAEGIVGNHIEASAIGIKADCVRVVGRQGVKIISGGDEYNSQGQFMQDAPSFGIDLIANNDDSDLQPIVKGESLIEFLDELLELIDNLSGILNGFLSTQMELNEIIGNHTHHSPFRADMTLYSLPLQQKTASTLIAQLDLVKKSILQFKANLAAFRENYLQPYSDNYILSRYIFAN